MNISEHRWMQVSLKSDIKMLITIKVYLLESKNHEIVNKILNKLHNQKKLSWAENHISSEYSVFVVWQNVIKNDKIIKKKQLIINLWNLNKITESDFYFTLFQTDIIQAVVSCLYISVLNAASFFYQWKIWSSHKSWLSIILHKD